jgi:hypothetical protein
MISACHGREAQECVCCARQADGGPEHTLFVLLRARDSAARGAGHAILVPPPNKKPGAVEPRAQIRKTRISAISKMMSGRKSNFAIRASARWQQRACLRAGDADWCLRFCFFCKVLRPRHDLRRRASQRGYVAIPRRNSVRLAPAPIIKAKSAPPIRKRQPIST